MEHSSTTFTPGRINSNVTSASSHNIDTTRQRGTVAFFAGTLAIGVFTVFGDAIQSLLHGL